MREALQQHYERFVRIGISASATAESRRLLLFHRFAVVAFFWVPLALGLMIFFAEVPALLALPIGLFLLYAGALALTLSGRHLASKILYNYGVMAVVGLGYLWVGGRNTVYLWFFGTMVYAAAVFSKDERLPKYLSFVLSFLGFTFALLNNAWFGGFDSPVSAALSRQVLLYSDVAALTVTGLIIVFLAESTRAMETKLEDAFERNERLLLNILPRATAKRLKENPDLIADGYDEVSVLFCDIVGFTSLSEKLSPHELVALLNALFSQFDLLTEKHQLEKIKTIGDAYMVAAGLPEPSGTHLRRLADMALDMREVVEQFGESQHDPLQVRIGMHVGPVVAGVIGQLKFAYDLWGSTVNIASRMESSGEAGRIMVSRQVYDRLQRSYCFEARGGLSIKGTDMMKTYFLLDRK